MHLRRPLRRSRLILKKRLLTLKKRKSQLKPKPKSKLGTAKSNLSKKNIKQSLLVKATQPKKGTKPDKKSKELTLKPVTVKPPKDTSKYKLLGSQIKPNAPPVGSD